MQNRFFLIHYTPFKFYHRKVMKKYNFQNDGAKFFYNISLAFGYNSYSPRDGEWDTPWGDDLILPPGYDMPDLSKDFNKSFAQISDETALDIAKRIDNTDEQFLILYSGGIDSTAIVAALIKNLTDKQLNNITISMSFDSIIENEFFYNRFIKDKLKIHNSKEFDMRRTVVEQNYTVIVGDQGDALFGTELGTKLYPSIPYYFDYTKEAYALKANIGNPEVHYSEYKQAIIKYFNLCFDGRYFKYYNTEKSSFDKAFGEMYYNKMVRNIETAKCKVTTLHDFFWWIIFNPKYMHCALRAGSIQSTGVDRSKIYEKQINWFNAIDFQLWSMANNNNGQKILGTTQGRYKMAAKDYIHSVDANDWYYWYKMKIPSKQIIVNRHRIEINDELDNMFGLDENYQMKYFNDEGIEEYFYEKLKNFNG